MAGHLAYYYALKSGEASRVTPVTAAYPVVTVLLVCLLLGEKLTWSKVVGVLLIVAGVILLKK
ncbi:MAG: EamA family transporter [Firmicutes bacterium]|nr:EamA family transporter [Bacillota bacterium]